MRILTWNMWGIPTENHRRRHDALVEAMARAEPDIAFVEEAWTPTASAALGRLDAYHRVCSLTRLRRTPRGGLVTLIRRDLVTGDLKQRFEAYPLPRRPRRRTVRGVVDLVLEWVGAKGLQHVVAPLGGRRYHLINTHLFCPDTEVPPSKMGDQTSPLLENQMGRLVRYVRRLARHGDPIIVAGDFNVAEGSRYHASLLRGFAEQISDLSHGLAAPSFPDYDARIDYVFGSAMRYVAARYYIDPTVDHTLRMSDHPAIVVDTAP